MKKFLVLLFLMAVVCISASARKSYITMFTHNFISGSCSSSGHISLSGEIPRDIDNMGFTYESELDLWYADYYDGSSARHSTAEILNWLSEYGYEVEYADENRFLLSKETTSNQMPVEGDVNKDGEVTIADVNKVINIILGVIRDNPSLLKQ